MPWPIRPSTASTRATNSTGCWGPSTRANPLYPLPDPVERAWQQSRALVMEVDMTHISQAQWQEMGAITRLVDGKTLRITCPSTSTVAPRSPPARTV